VPFLASTPAATRPSQMKLWCNGELILDTRLTTTAPVTTYVRTDWHDNWLLLESEASRVVPLRQLGLDDDREIGVRLEWTGTQAPSGDRPTHSCGRQITDPPPVTVTSFASNTAFPSPIFVPITWTAKASGGRAPLLYQFWRLKQGIGWTMARDYSQENTLTWTPIAGDAGSYVLQVWIKGSGSQNAFDAWSGTAFTIRGTARPTLNASVPLPAPANTLITWSASATAGVPPVQFKFYLLDAKAGQWTVLQDYSPTPSVTWLPASEGTYLLQAWVRSAGSSAEFEDWVSSGYFRIGPANP